MTRSCKATDGSASDGKEGRKDEHLAGVTGYVDCPLASYVYREKNLCIYGRQFFFSFGDKGYLREFGVVGGGGT